MECYKISFMLMIATTLGHPHLRSQITYLSTEGSEIRSIQCCLCLVSLVCIVQENKFPLGPAKSVKFQRNGEWKRENFTSIYYPEGQISTSISVTQKTIKIKYKELCHKKLLL